MPSGVTVPLTIQVFKGQTLVRTETLTQDIIKIGKLQSSHLQLEDESVSRMHAVIETAPTGEVTIVDLGSTRGTFVNGNRVNKARVSSGDEVRIGDVRLVIALEQQDAQAAAPVVADPARPLMGPRPTAMGVPLPPSAPAAPPLTAPAPPMVAMAPLAAPPAPPPAPQVPSYMAPPSMPAPAAVPAPFAMPRAAAPMAQAAVVPPHIAEQVEVRDGSSAVEVSAMFEDAVLEVRHFDNPSGGVVTGATKGILVSAGASLLALVVLFLVSYGQVAKFKADREAWEHAGKNFADFPVPREGAGRDVAASFLLIYGAGALLLGLFRLAGERRPNEFTIGDDPQATFNASREGLPVSRFPLVRSTGSDYEFLFTMAMSGDIQIGQKSMSLSDASSSGQARPSSVVTGAFAMIVPQGARINVRHGDITYNINSVPPPRYYPVPFAIDWGTQSYTGGVFAAVALFLLLIFSVPPDPKSLSLDSFLNDQRIAKILNTPPVPPETPDWLKKEIAAKEESAASRRSKDTSGSIGRDKPVPKNGALKIQGTSKDLALAKASAIDAAKTAGVLGAIASSSAFAAISGGASALGGDATNALGGLLATEAGDAFGTGGVGILNAGGPGGGGSGDFGIGVGNIGTSGIGGGNRSYGKGKGGLAGRKAAAPDVIPGTAEVKGSLDKELIRRIIRRHINEVKFCYEKELTRNTNLQGRVMIQFTISSSGSVASSVVQSSTMGNPTVEQCIAGALRRWEFPKPQGGIVVVSYPFVLKAAE